MKRYGALFILFLVLSCHGIIKTDLNNLLINPERYRGKRVILMTDLKDLEKRRDLYLNKRVELSGYVKYNGYRGFKTWNFILREGDKRIRCYEDNYRIEAWAFATDIIRLAEREKGRVEVIGRVKVGFNNELQLELDWFRYKGYRIDTDYKPSNIRLPFW